MSLGQARCRHRAAGRGAHRPGTSLRRIVGHMATEVRFDPYVRCEQRYRRPRAHPWVTGRRERDALPIHGGVRQCHRRTLAGAA